MSDIKSSKPAIVCPHPADKMISKIVEVGDTLHRCGCTPYKVERYIHDYASKYGVEVTIQATPTTLNYQFHSFDNKIILSRQRPASINLSLLASTIKRTHSSIDANIDKPKPYPQWLLALANMTIPPAFLMLVNVGGDALWISAILGFFIWFCQFALVGRREIAVEFFGALITGFLAVLFSSLHFDIPLWGMCIAAVLLFVPGLTISNTLECLAFNELVSGASLLGQCLVVLIKLFAGILIGIELGQMLFGVIESAESSTSLPLALRLVALPLLSISLSITFQARPIDMLYGFPVAVLGMWGPMLLGGWVVGTWATAMFITLYGNWIAKRLKLTSIIYTTQGIIILVPGSRVLIGASQSLFGESILPMPSVGLSAAYMFSAIVVGQITAYALYSPSLHGRHSGDEKQDAST